MSTAVFKVKGYYLASLFILNMHYSAFFFLFVFWFIAAQILSTLSTQEGHNTIGGKSTK